MKFFFARECSVQQGRLPKRPLLTNSQFTTICFKEKSSQLYLTRVAVDT